MSVDATINTDTITVNPTKVRYSLSLGKLGLRQHGYLMLQRSDKRLDGTWLDDPRVGSYKQVNLTIGPAVEGIVAILPTILARIGVTDEFTDFRLRLNGSLSAAGVLYVLTTVQIRTTVGKWIATVVPSLATFLGANQDIALQILGAWDALDVEINAANQQEGWL